MTRRQITDSPAWARWTVGLLAVAAIALAVFEVGVQSTPTPVTHPAAVKTVKGDPVLVLKAAPTPGPVVAARRVKPLADLTAGDRVLYGVAGEPRRLCRWVYWGGSIESAAIQCGSERLVVKTGFLTPVEGR